jgi:hypothetical protein
MHMAGAPSVLDMFDHKPKLNELNGEPCPESYYKGQQFAFIKGVPKLLGSPHAFAKHGESGQVMSELLPHLATVADDLAVIRSMHTDQFNHAPAQLFLHTGSPRLGRPGMGAWLSYGLGTENKDLPSFVVLISTPNAPDGGASLWGSGFLPTIHQGVQMRSQGEPVLFLNNPEGMSSEQRRSSRQQLPAGAATGRKRRSFRTALSLGLGPARRQQDQRHSLWPRRPLPRGGPRIGGANPRLEAPRLARVNAAGMGR